MRNRVNLVIALFCLVPFLAGQEPDSEKIVRKEVIEAQAEIRIDEPKPLLGLWLDPMEALDTLLVGKEAKVQGEFDRKMEAVLFPRIVRFSRYLREPLASKKLSDRITIDLPEKARRKCKLWRLRIIDPAGTPVKTLRGKGRPPDRLEWNGLTDDGKLLEIGTPYACMLDLMGKDTVTLILEHINVPAFAFRRGNEIIVRIDASRAYDPELLRLTPWGRDVLREILNLAREEYVRGVDIAVYDDRADVARDCVGSVLDMFKRGIALNEDYIKAESRFPTGDLAGKRLIEIKLNKS
ncbi:MAG: hypothetical protein DRQ06_02515 [Candidatus Hydrothermota bacterium]|nr:MAG: hypothetical protein DRQ06_02515 [Candidatus Hydrothermae bacterium]RKZ03593.1 MAG: hypothetical protein DRQ04_02115 [Candidatus Hydrothermae bacterium]